MPKKKKYTFIDLFAGCGGLSEGFYRLGFKALAHVEFDHACCETIGYDIFADEMELTQTQNY